jgi:murein DD-endopeptidase MepM/ murein hydrolase activator NlpD
LEAKESPDGRVVIQDSRFSGFDAIEYVRRTHSGLAAHAEAISHWAGYYGVNPILLAHAAERDAAAAPFGAAAVRSLAERISAFASGQEDTARLAAMLSQALSVSVLDAEGLLDGTRSAMRFAGLSLPLAIVEASPPALDLPFAEPQAWQFNGAHTWTGSDDGSPMSSLDWASSWSQRWGDDTSNDWVAAAHDGEVTVFSSCFVHVQHPGGWSTRYYHLDNVLVTTGQRVRAGDRLANYANDEEQALCSGGHSNTPHMHFALLRDGQYVSLSDIAVSGYAVHPGSSSYDTHRDRMWLEKRGQRYYAFDLPIGRQPGDNTIDYRYNGMWYSPDHDGHGMNIEITESPDGEASRHTVFLVMYTYDDAGDANFYVGNRDFERWRSDEGQEIELLQTAGGDLVDLSPIDFDNPDQVMPAGQAEVRFLDCNRARVALLLYERTSGQPVEHSLALQRLIGVPAHVCEAASLPLP